MIHINDVTKIYEGKKVLDSVTLNLAAAKTHVLLGSSGSGKTTLLKIIMGLMDATSGTVEINGKVVSAQWQREVALQIGYVPQDGGLFPHLTAERNVELVARNLQWSKSQCRERLEALVELLDLDTELLSHFPKELSGGQKQRMALLRALFLDPPVMVFDEPFAALDPLQRNFLQQEFRSLFQKMGKTVLFVTHDLREAEIFSQSVTLLHDGQVQQHGVIEDLFKNPANAFVQEFIQTR